MKTVVEALESHARHRGDRPALWYGEQTMTFAEADERSSRVASALDGAGVRPGDRVALLDKNAPEFVDLLFGTCKLGAVLVPVNYRLSPSEVAFVVGDAGAKVLVVGAEFRDGAELCDAPTTVVLGEQFDAWREGADPRRGQPRATSRDVAIQMYTSGTTGLPKGAMLTHDNLVCLLRTYSAIWDIDEDSIGLTVMPLYHVAGLACLMVAMGNGVPTVLLREAVPDDILAAIARHRVTTTIFVPALIQALLACDAMRSTDLSSLRRIGYGASPISDDVLVRALEVFGCDFQQGYALTETSAIGTCLSPEDHRHWREHPQRLRSAGRPMPEAQVQVVDPDSGAGLAAGQVGEVWLRSGGTMAGYWNRPEARTLSPELLK